MKIIVFIAIALSAWGMSRYTLAAPSESMAPLTPDEKHIVADCKLNYSY